MTGERRVKIMMIKERYEAAKTPFGLHFPC